MTIKSIYYWPLCKVQYHHKYEYYGRVVEQTVDLYLLPDNLDSVKKARHHLNYFNSKTTYDELLKQRDDKWIKFCNEFLTGDTLLFITVPEQAAQLACDLKKYDLEWHLKYKSPLAVNRNYPENGHVLQLWILHKD